MSIRGPGEVRSRGQLLDLGERMVPAGVCVGDAPVCVFTAAADEIAHLAARRRPGGEGPLRSRGEGDRRPSPARADDPQVDRGQGRGQIEGNPGAVWRPGRFPAGGAHEWGRGARAVGVLKVDLVSEGVGDLAAIGRPARVLAVCGDDDGGGRGAVGVRHPDAMVPFRGAGDEGDPGPVRGPRPVRRCIRRW